METYVMSPWQVVHHVRRVPKCSEDKKNPNLRGDSVELYSRERIVGCAPKVPYWL